MEAHHHAHTACRKWTHYFREFLNTVVCQRRSLGSIFLTTGFNPLKKPGEKLRAIGSVHLSMMSRADSTQF